MGKSCQVASLPYKSSYNISKFQLLLLVLEFPMLQTSNLAVFPYIPLYVAAHMWFCVSAFILKHPCTTMWIFTASKRANFIRILSIYLALNIPRHIELSDHTPKIAQPMPVILTLQSVISMSVVLTNSKSIRNSGLSLILVGVLICWCRSQVNHKQRSTLRHTIVSNTLT